MKIFISSDMEGTAGIVAWPETELDKSSAYPHFAEQMSREVAGACEGALEAGADEILVKDAHDFARNINPELLPEEAKIFRGWGSMPQSMMAGIDDSFAGAILTGYHSAAGMDTSPLAHTMTTRLMYVKCNGKLMPEAVINAMTASYYGVPVVAITGDQGICDYLKQYIPKIVTIPVTEGCGAGAISVQPAKAVRMIREGVKQAVSMLKEVPSAELMFPMPKHFEIEIAYKQHMEAKSASWYPGASLKEPHVVTFVSDDYGEVLRMMHFLL